MSRILLTLVLLFLSIRFGPVHAAEPQRPQILVFAAASLTDALREIGDSYERVAPVRVAMSFDASSNMARQIEAGAPADVFFSADTPWMDYLEKRNLLRAGTRQNVLGNRLVLIAAAGSRIDLKIAPHFPLLAALGSGRLAIGDPESVPAGRYARTALSRLGLWDALEPRLALAENVRAALVYVARGEAPLGIVYATDALVERKVRVVDTFADDTHEPILYPVALTRFAKNEASGFVTYLISSHGREIFARYGFTEPAAETRERAEADPPATGSP
jgi:molybdate transport system substrate-binding protein